MTFEEATNYITHSFLEIFNMAEDYFGKAEKEWSFIGIEFKDDGPYIMYYPNNKISIVLSTGCSNNFQQLFFQLSHETCHLLYPTGKKDANILNEGIAVCFSVVYDRYKFKNSTYAINALTDKYREAYNLVSKLLAIDKDAIKKIRSVYSNISNISKDELMSFNFNLDEIETEKLVSKF